MGVHATTMDISTFLDRRWYLKLKDLKWFWCKEGYEVVVIGKRELDDHSYVHFVVTDTMGESYSLLGHFHDITDYDPEEGPYAKFEFMTFDQLNLETIVHL